MGSFYCKSRRSTKFQIGYNDFLRAQIGRHARHALVGLHARKDFERQAMRSQVIAYRHETIAQRVADLVFFGNLLRLASTFDTDNHFQRNVVGANV